MPSTFKLAYLDLTTPDLEAAKAYWRGVLGLVETHADGRSAYLGLGLDHHTIALHASGMPSLGAIGLQMSAGLDVDVVVTRLRHLGFDPKVRHDTRPGVPVLIEIRNVGGHDFHLLPDFQIVTDRAAGTGINPLRLGHVAILTQAPARVLSLLTEGLGFWATDWFDDFVTFVTCNRDHHVLNVIEAPVSTLHHIAFQLVDREHQFRAADLLAEHSLPTLWGPARHTAGHNIASYHHGADKALIELFSDMDVYVPELGYCEPRPWHGDRPQRPKHWPIASMSRWETRYEFDLAQVSFGLPRERA